MFPPLRKFEEILNKDKFKEIKILKIIIYPIKSFKGIIVDKCVIDGFGFQYDRMYMLGVWDEKLQKYKSITQRECPKLCLCKVEFDGDFFFKISWEDGNESFKLPTVMDENFLKNNCSSHGEFPAHLWGVNFTTFVLDKFEIPDSFIKFINFQSSKKINFLYSQKGKFVKTNVPKSLTLNKDFKQLSTRFQEYFPSLIMNEADIRDLECRINQDDDNDSSSFQVSYENFRPNLVVTGEDPYQIDTWSTINITPINKKWLIISKCPRCTIPNINCKTGITDKLNRISRKLAQYRRIDPGQKNFFFLGVHGIQLDVNYELKVGYRINIEERHINYYKPLE
ncbi:hypothetical protein PACTADRAFT_32630 [Pachysolen tannophilus NRRL Y-2460]|uniref:MOSC domain-containing protein n=1 Tax=Pachysolen tannophilus NRRL Y-2460 TaxID=669874 RepID=A0A1E4TZH2_PACTA|nr:hypothetical protein PACTADRAFT_32630 [Pachysolen tannophilus NRRL Y-2460]